jgi:hypothetical protein
VIYLQLLKGTETIKNEYALSEYRDGVKSRRDKISMYIQCSSVVDKVQMTPQKSLHKPFI